MRTAHILYKDEQPASVNGYVAERGFRARGYEVISFEHMADLSCGRPNDEIVFGSVQATRAALVQIGVTPPSNIDIPDSLACYAGRKVWKTNLAEIRQVAGSSDPRRYRPVFIKPLYEHKKFPGHVISKYTDMLRTEEYAWDEPVLAQDVIRFNSEWRVFVLQGEVVGMAHYNGDPMMMPHNHRIAAMVRNFSDAPVAYGLDVGRVVGTGDTHLVEVNDAFALGSYGLAAHLYTAMIEARWDQMVAT